MPKPCVTILTFVLSMNVFMGSDECMGLQLQSAILRFLFIFPVHASLVDDDASIDAAQNSAADFNIYIPRLPLSASKSLICKQG